MRAFRFTLHLIQVLTMRKRIKGMGFSDWDTMFYNNFLSIPILVVFSVLVENWSWENLVKNLCVVLRRSG